MIHERNPSINTTDPGSNTPSLAEDEATIDIAINTGKNADTNLVHRTTNTNSSSSVNKSTASVKRLSSVAQMYDVDGDGELDEAEQQMYDMDKSKRGYLTNDKVYTMMQAQIDIQNQLFRTRRIMFVLLALVVILAISNLGTSFAAAHLAKETTTNENDELSHKTNGETISTQTAGETLDIVRATLDENGRRKLCDSDTDHCWDTESFLSMDKHDCKRLRKKCKRGNSVGLRHLWPNGAKSYVNACPFTSGQEDEFGISHYRNGEGKDVYVEEDDEGHCKFRGNAFQQGEREFCHGEGHCIDYNIAGNPLLCVKLDFVVDRCKDICDRRRYTQERQKECKIRCDYATCQQKALVEAGEYPDLWGW